MGRSLDIFFAVALVLSAATGIGGSQTTAHKRKLLLEAPTAAANLNCYAEALSEPLDSSWMEATSTPNSRDVPDLSNNGYGWGDWPEDAHGMPQATTSTEAWRTACPGVVALDIVHFKVYNSTVWADWAKPASSGGYEFLEMLMLTLWLYKDLPQELDIIVNFSDHVVECDIQAPVMQTTVLDAKSSVDGHDINADLRHLVWPLKGTENRSVTHTRGYTMPYKDAWHHSSLAPKTMQAYATCLESRYASGAHAACGGPADTGTIGPRNAWAAARKPQLIWRGSSTGYLKGWSVGRTSDPSAHPNTLGSVLWNKRLYAVMLSRPYAWMDVGLTQLDRVSFTRPETKQTAEVLAMLKEVAIKKRVDLEQQSSYQLALSLDGHGAPWRLPKQLLGMSPILKVDSPNKVFFERRLVSGIHYQPVRYDLSNLVEIARQMVAEADTNSSRLQCMAVAARNVAVEHLNGLAQLDAFAWSLAKLQAAYKWRVLSPAEELQQYSRQWHVAVHHGWRSHGFAHLKKHLMHQFPNNF